MSSWTYDKPLCDLKQVNRIISPPSDCLKEVGIARIVVVSEFTIIQTETCLPQLQHHVYLTHTQTHT